MKKILYTLFTFLLIVSFNCSTVKNIQSANTLAASDLQPIGRYRITDDKNLELISSAVHFGFSFTGNECKIFAHINDVKGHNYLQYELDGIYQKRMRVEGNSNQPFVLTTTSGRHTVWIYKATEAGTVPIFIEKIAAQNVKALSIPKAPLIEFIGNSITCGAAADASEVPCGTGQYHDQHNAYYSYASRVGRALKVNYILSSVSGIGMYRNWNSDGPAMPQVYEKTDFQDRSSNLWNFKTYSPNIVSIALGTNDFSNGDGKKKRLPFDSSLFVDHYINFVQLILSKHPHTKIVLLNSPMVNGTRGILLQNCLEAVKKYFDIINKENTISLFFFKPMLGRGCGGHPSVEDHEILAQQLIPFLGKLL